MMKLKKGYKQTEIGVIPEDWKIINFGETADSHVKWSITGGPFGSNLKISDYTDKGIRIIQLQNIGDGEFINKEKIYTSIEKADELLSANIYPNEIILSKMGYPVARACFIPPNKENRYLMASDGIRLVINEAKFDKKFIHDYINSTYFRKRAFEVSIGTTRLRIGLPNLKSLKVIYPSLEEQKAIAQVLTDTDQLIQNIKTLIEKKKAIKKGAMQKLLTPKQDWELKKLGGILQFGSGKDYKHLKSGIIPVYGTGGIMTYVNDYLFEGESIGIGRKGTIDKPVLLNGKFWTVDTLFYTHSFKDSNPKYIYYQFLLINWKEYNEASGVPSLNKNTLEQIEIHIPSFVVQTRIANILTDMDSEIGALEIQLQKTQNLKQGMMQELLTGKIRLVKTVSQSVEEEENKNSAMAAEPEVVYKTKS